MTTDSGTPIHVGIYHEYCGYPVKMWIKEFMTKTVTFSHLEEETPSVLENHLSFCQENFSPRET